MKKTKFINIIISIFLIIPIFILSRYVFLNHFFNLKNTTVPNILFMPEEEALALLNKANLNYNIIYSKSNDVKEGYTFIQHPEANSIVKINRNIQVWVNNNEKVDFPTIIGEDLISARKYLEKSGIQIERIDYIPTNGENNIILATYPSSSNKIGLLKKVSLLVSSKDLLQAKIMPNLIGIDLNDAISILAQLNLKIKNISDASDNSLPINSIIATNPLPGDNIDEKTEINVVLNSGTVIQKSITEIIEENKVNNEEEKKKENNLTNDQIQNILDKTLKDLNKKEGE